LYSGAEIGADAFSRQLPNYSARTFCTNFPVQKLWSDDISGGRRNCGNYFVDRAAYAGALAITTTSGPGMALKREAMDLRWPSRFRWSFATSSGEGVNRVANKTEQANLLQRFLA